MTIFAVITKVSNRLTGNRACGEILVRPSADRCMVGSCLVVDPPMTIRGYDKLFGEALRSDDNEVSTINLKKRQLLFCYVPVFKLGEILILDSKWGRTIPDGRKPSKWDVNYECFRSLKKAIERAKQVVD